VEGIDCLVILLVLLVAGTSGRSERTRKRQTHGESFEESGSVCQELAVSREFLGDILPLEPSVFDKDPIPGGPTDYGEVDDAETLSKEIGPADLVGVALEIFHPLGQGGRLKLRGLSVEDAEVTGHDILVDKIDPDPGLSGLVGIGGYQAGFVLGVSIFEELKDDVRVVKRFPLIRDGGDQSFGIESYRSVAWQVKGAEISKWTKRGRQEGEETRDREKRG